MAVFYKYEYRNKMKLTSIIDFTLSANSFSFVKDESVFSERALSFIVVLSMD